MKTETLRRQVDTLLSEIEKLEKRVQSKICLLQMRCAHPINELLETDYMPSESGYFSTLPPMRVCKRCGFSEDGWRSADYGRRKLHWDTTVPIVKRDELYKHRLMYCETENYL